MTTIHQDVLVRSWVSCAVPDCAQAFHVDEQVQDNAVRETDATIGYSRQLGTKKLLDDAKAAGWVIGAHDNVCPVHVGAAIYDYMNRIREQAKQIAETR
jgi:hypothetical protein